MKMKTRKTSYPPIIIGTSFLLVVFILLCMIIFAVLSLSSTVKDYNYSTKAATRTTEYYNANNTAEEILAQIDAILALGSATDAMTQELLAIEGLSVTSVKDSSDFIIEYAVFINDSKLLQVILTTQLNQAKRYTITTWKQISVTDWSGHESLPVLGSHS